MLKLALSAAMAIGTDPITLALVTVQAIVCAFVMRAMLRSSVGVFAFSPVLWAFGFLAAYIALAVGFVDVLDVHMGDDGDWALDWKAAAKALPNIVISSMAGICVGALMIVALLREMQRHI